MWLSRPESLVCGWKRGGLSGGVGELHLQAEGFELPDEPAGLVFAGVAARRPVRAEFAVVDAVVHDVPVRDEQVVAGRADGFERAPSAADRGVVRSQVRALGARRLSLELRARPRRSRGALCRCRLLPRPAPLPPRRPPRPLRARPRHLLRVGRQQRPGPRTDGAADRSHRRGARRRPRRASARDRDGVVLPLHRRADGAAHRRVGGGARGPGRRQAATGDHRPLKPATARRTALVSSPSGA